MTRAEAHAALAKLALGICEADEEQAAARLVERLAGAEPELRAALLEVGARALIGQAGRGGAAA